MPEVRPRFDPGAPGYSDTEAKLAASNAHPRRIDSKGGLMNAKGFVIATAVATMFLSGAVTARAEEKAGGDQVVCDGINACKGQGSCAGAGHSCAGKNACKGQGHTKTTAADCTAKGGKVVEGKK
jgi:uncharacterized membrane protein